MLFLFETNDNPMKQTKNGWWLILIGLGIFLIAISPQLRFRWDLSEEKKFTLSESSLQVLQSLDGPISIKVYLGGRNLPGGFRRLEKALLELLDDVRAQSPQRIDIEQIDVYKTYPKEKERQALIFYLDSLGIPPTNVVNQEDGHQVQQLIFPGIIIEKSERQAAVLLLKGNKLSSSQEVLNQSIEGLEYELMQGIRQVQDNQERKKIGFFLDHSQVPAIMQLDLIAQLKKSYDLYPVDLSQSQTLDGLDAICVIQPTIKFNSEDLYKIDQFLVQGGKGIFFVDGIRVDTLEKQGLVLTPQDLGLQNLLFQYGIRLNANLVKDAQLCGAIPLAVGNFGNRANLELMPWPAFPLLIANPNSVITKNLDAVYGRFVSSLDTIQSGQQLSKTALLKTSPYTQVQKTPATLPFSASGKEFDPAKYQGGSQVVAYLVEGKFRSAFTNRILPSEKLAKPFQAQTNQAGSLIVVADGDIALNGIDPTTKGPLPLGFDTFAKHTFANKDFILNAFHYLLDDQNALLARNKNVRLRPLDKAKVKEDKSFWQGINLLVPISFAGIISLLVILYRKKKYNA
ncbi:gliding motility-associated ABC transporter substrate-binding protein GldG [Aquirufa rosea]|uniref:Gliding motility-associated ABC transporter substrate-binding protein GldG n=2 Tax=Aquirufa rosea TaxID=2509241 RepID=A0A4Q1BXT5_9BACT|nr:gliding motility-associated ABC transporter substrate-binding protein GldG [Aquirufa rosea]